jgi:hypothetical protein
LVAAPVLAAISNKSLSVSGDTATIGNLTATVGNSYITVGSTNVATSVKVKEIDGTIYIPLEEYAIYGMKKWYGASKFGFGVIANNERDIDFEVDANCYILNPPISHTRSYTFNAIHRPNIFWGTRYGLESSYPNYQIGQTKQWNARILWSDFEMTKEERDAFLSRSTGNGSGNYMSDSQRIKVTVPAGMKNGNVVV